MRAEIKNTVNEAINRMLRQIPAQTYVLEDLSHRFVMGGKYSKQVRNMLSKWVRGTIKERLLFKTACAGVLVAFVPAAQSSQHCPECGHTSRDNRKGDQFQCQHCGYTAHADQDGNTKNNPLGALQGAEQRPQTGATSKNRPRTARRVDAKPITQTRAKSRKNGAVGSFCSLGQTKWSNIPNAVGDHIACEVARLLRHADERPIAALDLIALYVDKRLGHADLRMLSGLDFDRMMSADHRLCVK